MIAIPTPVSLLIVSIVSGDMTSLTWIKSNFSKDSVQVTFSALNFRDPMVASRRLNITTLPYDGQISNLSEIDVLYLILSSFV